MATNIQDVYSIELPAGTRGLLDLLKGVVSFDITKTFGLPLECARLSGYVRKLTFMMLWPIVVVAGLLVGCIGTQWLGTLRKFRRARHLAQDAILRTYLPECSSTMTPSPPPSPPHSPPPLLRVRTTRSPPPPPGASPSAGGLWVRGTASLRVRLATALASEAWAETREGATRGMLAALPAVSIITFLAFPTVSSIAFRAWACVDFETHTKYDADNAPLQRAPPDVESFMRDDLRIQCGSPYGSPPPP